MNTRERTQYLANDIRTKIYGKDVREAIATGIEESGNTSQEARDITENLLDGSYDTGLLNTEIERRMEGLYNSKGQAMDELYADYANRAETLETTYAPRLTSVEQDVAQLADTAINVKTFGATGLGLVDDTQAFLDAIEYGKSVDNKHVFVPEGTYLIDTVSGIDDFGNIRIPSGFTFEMSNHTYLKAIPTSADRSSILCTDMNSNNITIKGGNLIGDRDEHLGETGEWGHGLVIQRGENITVENVNISDCWGDGITTRGEFSPNPVNVTIKNNVIDNCRRQGISIIGGINVNIYGNTIKNTNGIAPQYAIDIEDNEQTPDTEYTKNINIHDNYFQDNAGGTINILTAHDVKVQNNKIVYTKSFMPPVFNSVIHSAWGCQRSVITGNIIEGNGMIGHGIFLKGNDNAIIDGNIISGTKTQAIYIENSVTIAEQDFKVPSKNVTISRNKIIADKMESGESAIILSGENCAIENNTISGSKGTAISVSRRFSHGMYRYTTNSVISDNTIDDVEGFGIDTTNSTGVVVKNNTISNVVGNGIEGYGVTGLTVSKNSIRDVSNRPINLLNEAQYGFNEDCIVDGNIFLNCGGRVNATLSKRLMFSNNVIKNVNTNRVPDDPLINLAASLDSYVHHNKVYDDHETPIPLAIQAGSPSNIVSLNDLRLSNATTKVNGGTANNNFED